MTKARNEYIYRFTGTIFNKASCQASPKSKYAGQEYYNLKTILEEQPNKVIQVFQKKLENPQIWETITQSKCFQKRYLFLCRNQRGHYYLVNWEEIE